jgi:hypothetical protein
MHIKPKYSRLPTVIVRLLRLSYWLYGWVAVKKGSSDESVEEAATLVYTYLAFFSARHTPPRPETTQKNKSH